MNDLPYYEGFWWVPDEPDTQLAGRLLVDNGETHLCLTIDNPEMNLFSNRDARDYEIIHGRSSVGEKISLLKCFDLKSSQTSSGIESRTILANYVLVGGHIPVENETEGQFTELSVKWPGLKRWFFQSGVSVEHGRGNFKGFNIKYEPQDPIAFTLSDETKIVFDFGSDSLPMGGPLSDEVKFREVVWVSVKPIIPQDFSFYLEVLGELKHFFSLCQLEYSEPEVIGLFGNFNIEVLEDGTDIHPYLKVHMHASQRVISDKGLIPMDMLLPYQIIEENISDIMDGWHTLSSKILPARSLYFSSLYGKNRYIESTFLNLVQAAEVFHRNIYGGTYLRVEEYSSKVLPVLVAAIPNNLAREIKHVYSQRLEFFNEYSLAKRLKMMAQNHSDVFDEYVPDWKQKIREIVKARNYFTHYSGENVEKRPDVNDLVYYEAILRMMIELEMLTCAGVKAEELHNQAKSCQKYRWMFHPSKAEK